MKKISALTILILLPFLLGIGMLKAQVTIGADAAPKAHSVLELFAQYKTGEFGGLRLPQLTTTQRDDLHVELLGDDSAYGLMIYNITIHCVEYWNRLKWVSLCTGQATITFPEGDPTHPSFPWEGEERGPYTPTDQPNCTAHNPAFSFTVMSGMAYLHINVVNEETGQFFVTMDENPTVLQRSGIVRIANNCTLEYKDFLFTQNGATGLCIPGATVPVVTSQNGSTELCAGGAVYLYLPGIDPGTGYVWTRNGVEIARDVNYYIAKQAGSYRVYAGAIGCETPPSSTLSVTNVPGGAPTPVSLIVGQNQGFVCSSTGTTQIFATGTATGTIVWYKNGIKQTGPGMTGTVINAGIGTWFAVVENGTCSSIPSNEIVVTLDPHAGTAVVEPEFTVNGDPLASSTVNICEGGTLLLDVTNILPDVTYCWYVNNDLAGCGDHYEMDMAGMGENFILQCRGTHVSNCPTAGVVEIKISLGYAPAKPTLSSSTGHILCGNTATLTTPNMAAKYLWYKDGVLLVETAVNTLTVTGMGAYSLRVVSTQNCVSVLSNVLNINENSGVGTVTITPQITTINENETRSFTAEINPEDSQSQYLWTITGATPTTYTGKTVTVDFGAVGTATISVTATNACTPGGKIATVNGGSGITVTPLCADAVIASYSPNPATATIVGSSSTSLTVTPDGNPGNYTYAWFETSTPGTTLGTAATFSTNAAGEYKCTVTPKCGDHITTGMPATSVAFTVNAITITPAAAGDENQTVCMNTALTAIVFTTSGATTATVSGLPAGLTQSYSAPTLTISGTPTESGTFNYTVTLGNGVTTGTGITGVITVRTQPAQPSAIAGSTTPCKDATGVNYSVTSVVGVSYAWTVPGDWNITSGQGSNSIYVTIGATGGDITVTPSISGCTGSSRTLSTTINTVPATPGSISGTTPLCVPASAQTYSITAVPNTTSYTWTYPATGWSGTSTTNSISLTPGATAISGNITVKANNACGSSAASTFAVVANATPAQPSTITLSSSTICTGATGTASVTNVSGVSYAWTYSGTWSITSGAGTRSIGFTPTTSGTITVTPSANGCTGTARTSSSITVSSFTQDNPTGNSICAGNTYTFTLTAASGPATISYQWQTSTDDSNWSNALGTSTSANYTTPVMTTSGVTYFRRVATSSTCGTSIYSNSATVTVVGGPCVSNSFSTPATYVDVPISHASFPTITSLRFLTYNLGADPTMTPKQQMAYPGCPMDMTVFGGWYQWGRKNTDHTFRCDPTPAYTSDPRFVAGPISGTGTPDNSTQFIYNGSSPYDWHSPQTNTLWGTGALNTTTTTIPNNPCPGGYRVPTEHELALLSWEGGTATNTTNDQITSFSGTALLSPSGLWWVKVNNGVVATSFTANNMCGYAIYNGSDFTVAPTAGTNLLTATQEPLLFLPAAGHRNYSNGARSSVGTYGYYWSSSINGTYAYDLRFYGTNVNAYDTTYRADGFSVRCVAE